MTRVLITGGAGFIGSHVADAALAAGMSVAIIDDLSTGVKSNIPGEAAFHEVDIRDEDGLRRVFRAERPDVVCHQAAQASVTRSARDPLFDLAVNTIGTVNVLTAAASSDVGKIVLASTGGAIIGDVPDGTAATSATPPSPRTPYGCSKLAAEYYVEAYAREHGFDYSILRYANVYGPRQTDVGESGVVATFARQLIEGRDLAVNARARRGDGGCVRDYVYVGDVVAANLHAIGGGVARRVANVSTGVGTDTARLARLMISIHGGRSAIRQAPRRAGDVGRSVLAPDAETAPAVDLMTGLTRTVAWYRRKAGQAAGAAA